MNPKHVIDVARDFSEYPGARYERLGPGSGEAFRKQLLIKRLESLGDRDALVIRLDGTKGYGSSFLEEAFGGAVREGCRFDKDRVKFVSEDRSLVQEIWEYIDQAEKRRRMLAR